MRLRFPQILSSCFFIVALVFPSANQAPAFGASKFKVVTATTDMAALTASLPAR